MVEYHGMDQYHYDGVSEHACVNSFATTDGEEGSPLIPGKCDYRIGRWCGKPLADGEVEPPYCDGKKPHPKPYGKRD